MPAMTEDGLCHVTKREGLHVHDCCRDQGHKGKHLCGHGDMYSW